MSTFKEVLHRLVEGIVEAIEPLTEGPSESLLAVLAEDVVLGIFAYLVLHRNFRNFILPISVYRLLVPCPPEALVGRPHPYVLRVPLLVRL